LNRGILDSCFFTFGLVQNFRVKALSLGPAEIHAEQNRSPVLRFGTTGTGLDGHDRVEVVAFTGEKSTCFELGNVRVSVVEFAVEIFQQFFALRSVGFFLSEIDVGIDIADDAVELAVGDDLVVSLFAFAEHTLRFLLIVPEVGLRDSFFECLQFGAVTRNVKDNSARGRYAASGLHSDIASLQESFSLPES